MKRSQGIDTYPLYRNKYLGLLLSLCSSLRIADLQVIKILKKGQLTPTDTFDIDDKPSESVIITGSVYVTGITKKGNDELLNRVQICFLTPYEFCNLLVDFRDNYNPDNNTDKIQLWGKNSENELDKYLS